MNSQQPFIIHVDPNTLTFSTEVSPFTFQNCKDLVKRLLEDANAESQTDRKIILDFKKSQGCLMCGFILSSIIIIPLPFFCCYWSSQQKKITRATQNILKAWEEVAKIYNVKLVEHGIFVRLVTQSIYVQYGSNSYYEPQYFYEFSFNNNGLPNQNNINVLNQPPGVIASD
jgi:hypothetical protein